MDTSFFGELTLTLIRDVLNKENLVWQFGNSEYKKPYLDLFNTVNQHRVEVLGIVTDGRPYFFDMFEDTPVQMCHFHMAKTLAKYITRNPRLEVNKALWGIWHNRDNFNSQSFERILNAWYNSFYKELTETYIDNHGRKLFVKAKTRKAYNSLKRFTPWLFTYQNIRWLPKTNNSIEGVFSGIKSKVNVHNGLSIGRKMKLIHYLLSQK